MRYEVSKLKYQIASADGAEAINDVDEDETGLDVLRQNQRFLYHGELVLQQVHRRQSHYCLSLASSKSNRKMRN